MKVKRYKLKKEIEDVILDIAGIIMLLGIIEVIILISMV